LVEAAQNGHLESFGALYQQYYGCMVALAYSVLTDKHLAEDAAQQTFAIACRDLLKLKSKDKFGPWLAGICRNVSKQILTSRGKSNNLDEVSTVQPQNSYDPNFETIIRRAVWSLRTFYREPIILRYYNGLSYEQISASLGISTQVLNGRLIRAKRKIEKYLKHNGFTRFDYENP
jgi:RNA polymerase sigma-70 factor (ECF subfamily)